jgi:hypothetical protein
MQIHFALGSLAGFLSFLVDQSLGYYSHESLTLQKTPRVLQILTRGPSSNSNSNRGGRNGGGAYRWRDCSGEVVEDVGEVLGITTVCGSPSEIEQLDGSESFTGCQRRCGRKELVGDSLDSSVHARRRKTKVW